MFRSLMIALISLANLFCFKAAADQNFLNFSHPEGYYSLSYPDSWKKDEPKEGFDIILFAPPHSLTKRTEATVNIKSSLLPEEVTLEEFFIVNVDSLKGSMEDFNLLDSGTEDLNGTQSKYLIYSFKVGNIQITIQQFFLVANHRAILVSMGANSQYYDEYVPAFKEIIKSLKVY